MEIPHKHIDTCLMTSEVTGQGFQIHLQPLRRSGHLCKANWTLDVTPEGEMPLPQGKALRKALTGTQIVHFRDGSAAAMLIKALSRHQITAPDIHDVSSLTIRLCHGAGLPETADLDAIAALHAIPGPERQAAQTDLTARMRVLHRIWCATIRQSLNYADAIDRAPRLGLRPVAGIMSPEHGLPLPAPVLPDIDPPPGGWRMTPWSLEEASESALLFAEGSSLAELSRLLRRSPRAIKARFMLDGILVET